MSTALENRVTLLGHLGQDVELRELATGKKLARFSVATNEFRRSAEGAPEKTTTWHNLVAWDQLAQSISEKLRKGSKVMIEGKIAYRQYETQSGEKRNMTEIVVSAFRKLDKDPHVA